MIMDSLNNYQWFFIYLCILIIFYKSCWFDFESMFGI
jgi:hypothetical protein